jgi:hypothetical protein
MLTWLLATALLTAGVAFAASGPSQTLFSFETDADLKAIQTSHTEAALTGEHATDGKQALKITYLPAEWPNAAFKPSSAWDWSHSNGLAIDVTNPGSEAVEFGIRADDDPAADGQTHCRQGMDSIAPGKTQTFVLNFASDPMQFGMRGLPTVPGIHLLASSGKDFNPAHVIAFQVFLHQPAAPTTLIIDNVRLVDTHVSLDKIVDKFGQYTKANWPGKLHSGREFTPRRKTEQAELIAHPALADRDSYGGWAAGPKLKATGFFRTEKVHDKWWLVTPDGHLFFSMGMDCVNTWADTLTTGRESMFSWLPDKKDSLARHISHVSHVLYGPTKAGDAFNFYTANLKRKYGASYEIVWHVMALMRLKAWGFNTIGNWSDVNLNRNESMPYVATTGIGGSHARLSSGSDYWGKMHDPFDPQFATDVQTSLRDTIAKVKDDPWCLGYFVDNELSWAGMGEENGRYGLAYGALLAPAGSHAKQAFVAQLKGKYGDIARLNAAWKTDFAGWDVFNGPVELKVAPTPERQADMGAFVKALAHQYFTVIRDELKKHDPHHLYLGCRFAWSSEDAVEAAAEVCDVVSFNIYAPNIRGARWDHLTALNKPCIIGEFHFGALDRGMFHPGLVSTPNQQARAAMYVDYLHSVLDNPAFVGCHWFQFLDEPLTGRTLDGENYNIGFLDVTDTPYPEMVAAAKQVHQEAYTRRYGTSAAANPGK